jgi:hypothetical protein
VTSWEKGKPWPSAAEAAYEAFVAKLHNAQGTLTGKGTERVPPSSFAKLPPVSRDAWLAAAEAARGWERAT